MYILTFVDSLLPSYFVFILLFCFILSFTYDVLSYIIYSQEDDDEEEGIVPAAIFETMWSTIRFMVAAINRGQDYMKASNNVGLVPSNGTFDFADTLSMAYRCIRSIIPTGRHLVIHNLPASLQDNPMLISDSHWVMENVLCFVSNALKYSDSGDVDLIVTIVPTPTVVTLRDDSKESIGSFAGSGLVLPRLRADHLSVGS